MNWAWRFVAAIIVCGLAYTAQAADPVAITVAPLQLDRTDPARNTVGKLIWRGGLMLQGKHVDFGGYSGLRIEDGGKRLRAVSDTSTWLTLDLSYDAKGLLDGVANGLIGPLHDPMGRRLVGKANNDAESMTVLRDGSVLIGFEQKHRLWRYPSGSEASGGGMDGKPVPFAAPGGITLAPPNAGLECVTLLNDGRLLLITEDMRRGANQVAAWIGVPQSARYVWHDANYPTTGRFRPSDAATLPNGDVVVLERSYSILEGVRVRVMRLHQTDIVANTTFRVEQLALLQAPLIVENFEGVSAARGANGETLLWLIADDNFNPLQRTILLHFAIAE
ncbi:MAG: esterase-like activity of phytase family protein [Rhodospirillales bacterium]